MVTPLGFLLMKKDMERYLGRKNGRFANVTALKKVL